MGTSNIREVPVGDVFQATGYAGRAMLLHRRDIDDLGKFIRNQTDQVGSRIFFTKEIDFDGSEWVITKDGAARRFRSGDVDALRYVRFKVHDSQLIPEPIVDVDVFRTDSHRTNV